MTLSMHHDSANLSTVTARTRPGLQCQVLDDEAVLYDLANHAVHYLNATAYQIWRWCDQSTTVEDLVNQIASEYADDRADVYPELSQDVQHTLRELASNGLIDCVGL